MYAQTFFQPFSRPGQSWSLVRHIAVHVRYGYHYFIFARGLFCGSPESDEPSSIDEAFAGIFIDVEMGQNTEFVSMLY